MIRWVKRLITAAALFGLFFALGCAGDIRESDRLIEVDKHWGESYRRAKQNQILHPEAGDIVRPVFGLEGEAAGAAMDKHHNSFKSGPGSQLPPPAVISPSDAE